MALLFATVLAAGQATSTTEAEVERVVGEHPGNLVVVGAAALLLVVILAAGFLAQRRSRARARAAA